MCVVEGPLAAEQPAPLMPVHSLRGSSAPSDRHGTLKRKHAQCAAAHADPDQQQRTSQLAATCSQRQAAAGSPLVGSGLDSAPLHTKAAPVSDSEIQTVPQFASRITRPVMAGTGIVQATPMTDSTALYAQQDWAALRDRLNEDGYLAIRNVLKPSDVIEVGA